MEKEEESDKIKESDKIATIARKLGFGIRDPKKKRDKFPGEITLPHDLQRVWDVAVKNAVEWDNEQRGTSGLTPIQLDAIREAEFRKKVKDYPLCKNCDFINYKLQKCNIHTILVRYCPDHDPR